MFYHKGIDKWMSTPMGKEDKGLSAKQEMVIELVVGGMKDGEIAKRRMKRYDEEGPQVFKAS